MKTKQQRRLVILLSLWLVLTLLFGLLTYFTRETKPVWNRDVMREASSQMKEAMDKLYETKQTLGLDMDTCDVTESGVVGVSKLTAITTTDGILTAKQTSTNPNFAALFVSYLNDAGVKEGDEVGLMFSSSFPALNLACICACEAVGVKTCLMNSVGASEYGATDPDFTFMDMMKVLQDAGIISTRIDYLSFGGEGDLGLDFEDEDGIWISGNRDAETIKQQIKSRAESQGISFLSISDFSENVKTRVELIQEKIPNMKLFFSVGGSTVSIGRGTGAYIETGYQKPSVFQMNKIDLWSEVPKNFGLLQYFHSVGLPVVSMLNIEKIADDYHMEKIDSAPFEMEVGDMYRETSYHILFPCLILLTMVGFGIFVFPLSKKIRDEKKKQGKINQR